MENVLLFGASRGGQNFMKNYAGKYHFLAIIDNDTPSHFFEQCEELDFEGMRLPVPKNYEAYLDYSYGDWHVVKKSTSFADNTISFREPLFSCSNEDLYKTVKLVES